MDLGAKLPPAQLRDMWLSEKRYNKEAKQAPQYGSIAQRQSEGLLNLRS